MPRLALLRADILKSLTFAGVLTLAGMVSGLAIRLAFAGIHSIAGSGDFRPLICGIGSRHHSAVGECEQGGGRGERQVSFLTNIDDLLIQVHNIVTLSNSMRTPDRLQRAIFLFDIGRGLRARAVTCLSDTASNCGEGCIIVINDGAIALGDAQPPKKVHHIHRHR